MGVIPFSPARRNLRLRLQALLVTMDGMALTMDASARHIEKAVALQARWPALPPWSGTRNVHPERTRADENWKPPPRCP
ncbi:MAG: hypothetical protein DMF78_18760 [Acidobacteria bacterium]|nr:MAG: hypothetical protein DMF78_18760 [Acidobacteriota bacterium]